MWLHKGIINYWENNFSEYHCICILLIMSNTYTEKGTTETAASQDLMFEISLDFVLLVNPFNPKLIDVNV